MNAEERDAFEDQIMGAIALAAAIEESAVLDECNALWPEMNAALEALLAKAQNMKAHTASILSVLVEAFANGAISVVGSAYYTIGHPIKHNDPVLGALQILVQERLRALASRVDVALQTDVLLEDIDQLLKKDTSGDEHDE